jgi:hypothetical protein
VIQNFKEQPALRIKILQTFLALNSARQIFFLEAVRSSNGPNKSAYKHCLHEQTIAKLVTEACARGQHFFQTPFELTLNSPKRRTSNIKGRNPCHRKSDVQVSETGAPNSITFRRGVIKTQDGGGKYLAGSTIQVQGVCCGLSNDCIDGV